MTLRITGTMAAIAAALTLAVEPASANDQDLWAKAVAASACEPASENQAAEVSLSNGAWVFVGNNTGTVTFWCPLSLNAYTVSNGSHDNDVSSFRVYYRDSDGQSGQARVTARMTYRRADGLYAAGSTFDSNVSTNTGNTTRVHNVAHDVRSEALYGFLVTLRRSNANQSPAFSGIDFPFPAVP